MEQARSHAPSVQRTTSCTSLQPKSTPPVKKNSKAKLENSATTVIVQANTHNLNRRQNSDLEGTGFGSLSGHISLNVRRTLDDFRLDIAELP